MGAADDGDGFAHRVVAGVFVEGAAQVGAGVGHCWGWCGRSSGEDVVDLDVGAGADVSAAGVGAQCVAFVGGEGGVDEAGVGLGEFGDVGGAQGAVDVA